MPDYVVNFNYALAQQMVEAFRDVYHVDEVTISQPCIRLVFKYGNRDIELVTFRDFGGGWMQFIKGIEPVVYTAETDGRSFPLVKYAYSSQAIIPFADHAELMIRAVAFFKQYDHPDDDQP